MGRPAVDRRRAGLRLALLFIPVAGSVLLILWGMGNLSFDIWGAFIIAPVVYLLTYPFITRHARRAGDQRLVKILGWALAAKMAGTVVRYIVIFEVFGTGDAQGYHGFGRRIYGSFRSMEFSVDLGMAGDGTEAMRFITGIVYAGIGPSKLGGFFIFSLLSFIGLYAFFRAFQISFPDGDDHRYAIVLFFLPSMVFWPSSTGKEAWMALCLGLFAYGAAKLYRHHRSGLFLIVAGLAGMQLLRPHVAAIAVTALLVGFLLRRSRNQSTTAPLSRIVGLVVLIAMTMFVLGSAADFLGVDSLDQEGVETALERTTNRSNTGDAAFDTPSISSPARLPLGAVTVLMRPLPFEARNFVSLLASMETTALALILFHYRRDLVAAIKGSIRDPYLGFALAYTLLFVFAFSAISNFGILARQRVQVFPLLLVLVAAVPVAVPHWSHRDPDRAPAEATGGQAVGAG